MLDIDQLHLQGALLHEAAARLQFVSLGFAELLALSAILFGKQADDSSARRLIDQLHGARRGRTEKLPDLQTALGADDDLLAARVAIQFGVKGAKKAHGAMPHDPRRRHDVTPSQAFPHSSWPILKDHGGKKRALRPVWNMIQ